MPAIPSNGSATITNTTYGSVASFKCNSGHVIFGASTRLCQANGQWDGIPAVCDGEAIDAVRFRHVFVYSAKGLVGKLDPCLSVLPKLIFH